MCILYCGGGYVCGWMMCKKTVPSTVSSPTAVREKVLGKVDIVVDASECNGVVISAVGVKEEFWWEGFALDICATRTVDVAADVLEGQTSLCFGAGGVSE